MKSYLDLSKIYLFNDKKRITNIIIVIAIIISFVTATGIVTESIKNNKRIKAKELYGDYHAQFIDLNEEELNIIKNHAYVGKVGVKNKFASSIISDKWIIADIGQYDKDSREMLNVEMLYGEFPKEDYEIALEEWIIPLLGASTQLNNNVYFKFVDESENGIIHNELPKYFKLVGVLKNRSQVKPTIETVGLVGSKTIKKLPLSKRKYEVYIKINSKLNVKKALDEIALNSGINKNKILYNYDFINNLDNLSNLDYIKVTFMFIIFVVSAGTINNIFNNFNFDRIRHFGILRTMGATVQQVTKICIIEAAIISLFSIPLGILLGIINSKILINALPLFNVESYDLFINGEVILAIIILSFIIIEYSALKSIRIAKYNTVSSIVKINSKIYYGSESQNITGHNLVFRIFGISGKIAYQNMWRNQKRTKNNIMSISTSLIIFIMLSAFVFSFNPEIIAKNIGKTDYIIKSYQKTGYTLNQYSKISELEGVKNIYTTQALKVHVDLSTEHNKKEIYESDEDILIFQNKGYLESNFLGYNNEILSVLKEELIEGKLNPYEMSRTGKVLVNKAFIDYYKDVNIGDKIPARITFLDGDKISYHTMEFEVGGIIAKIPINYWFNETEPCIIAHEDVFKKYTKYKLYNQFNIELEEDANINEIEEQLNNIANSIPKGSLTSFTREVMKYEKYKSNIALLTIILMSIILMVSILNIINSFNVNINFRVKEISIFKALGMTGKQLIKVIVLEGLFLGVISSLIGTVLGVVSTGVMIKILNKIIPYVKWLIPVNVVMYSFIGCILVSLVAVMISFRSLSKMDFRVNIRNMQ